MTDEACLQTSDHDFARLQVWVGRLRDAYQPRTPAPLLVLTPRPRETRERAKYGRFTDQYVREQLQRMAEACVEATK